MPVWTPVEVVEGDRGALHNTHALSTGDLPQPQRAIVTATEKDSVRSGVIDPSAPTALTINSGDIVSYPNTWTQWGNEARYGMSFAEREPIRRRYPSGPYSNIGPIEVRGAQPGDVIE